MTLRTNFLDVYYTINPIAMKVSEVVEYTPAKVAGIKFDLYHNEFP